MSFFVRLVTLVFGWIFQTFIGWIVEYLFEDEIRTLMSIMSIVGATALGIFAFVFNEKKKDVEPQSDKVSMVMVYEYLDEVDKLSSKPLYYDGTAVVNKYGVNLNHDSKDKPEWAMGASCDVFSYRTKNYGKWAVGKYVWVVVFKGEQVVFSKTSLPKQINQEMKENCTILIE